jgi:serine kinase of HPr protein (carbohydrate metabolism regulator)
MVQFDLHASALTIKEAGVLIRGASGSGKSRLALALITAAHAKGAFSRLIGDDRIKLENCSGRLIARGHSNIPGQIEQRGVGILRLPFLSAAVIRLVVDLAPADQAPRHPDALGAGVTDKDFLDSRDKGAIWRCADWDFRGLNRLELNGVRTPLLVLATSAAACDLALAVLQCFRF